MTAPLGADVHGLDISRPLDDSAVEQLHAAWVEYKVLFFRDQELTPDQHKAFARYFGEFQAPGFVPSLPNFMRAHRLMHRVAIAGTERPFFRPPDQSGQFPNLGTARPDGPGAM